MISQARGDGNEARLKSLADESEGVGGSSQPTLRASQGHRRHERVDIAHSFGLGK